MEEHATFEARAVLAPRRARTARLTLVVPVIVLVAIVLAGFGGARADKAIAVIPEPTAFAEASIAVEQSAPQYPARAIGIDVQRLGDLQVGGLGFDSVVAIAGWYVPTAIVDCPPLVAIYRDGSVPYPREAADPLANCVRTGLLYPSRPNVPNNGSPGSVPASVAVTVVVGVIMPRQLETVGNDPTAVVVLGRFAKIGDGCRSGVGCSRELLVDHLAWTSGA